MPAIGILRRLPIVYKSREMLLTDLGFLKADLAFLKCLAWPLEGTIS